jgi:predicted deacylase
MTDEESVHAQVDGALSVIAHLKIMDAPSLRGEARVDRAGRGAARSPDGSVAPRARPARERRQGSLIGRIHDPFGKLLAEIRAPFAGELLYVVGTPPVTEGEPLGFVGRLQESQPKR